MFNLSNAYLLLNSRDLENFGWSFVPGGITREYGPQNWSVLVIA